MKNLILFILLFIPFLLVAQDDVSTATMNNQTDEWMTKISSDPDMRIKMMDMMIEQTKDNEEEMQKLVTSLLLDADMNKMITKANNKRANNETVYVAPLMNESDSSRVGKMNHTAPMPKK